MFRYYVKVIHKPITVCFMLLGFLFLVHNGYACQQAPGFGEITRAELEMKVYAADTSADAVILYEGGDITIEPTTTAGTVLRRHIKIKILKKGGLDQGDFKFSVEHGGFSRLKGATWFLENGAIVKKPLEENSVFKKKNNQGWDEITIAFPALRVGCVLECSFTLGYEGLYLPEWQFQHSIPVVCSEFTMVSPAYGNTFVLRGTIPFTKQESKAKDTHRFWQICNIPAFKEEPLMPDPSAYQSRISFTTPNNSWVKIYSRLKGQKNFNGVIYGSKKLQDTVDHIVSGIVDPQEKIRLISEWVKAHVQWEGTEDLYADEPVTVLERKKGTSADINLMLMCLLKKAGFLVEPVLVSTRDHGFVHEDFPTISSFNYVVCKLTDQNKEWFLDATEKFLPWNLLPSRCFNHKGFVIGNGFYNWVAMEPAAAPKTSLEANLLVDEDFLTGKVTIARDGYAAAEARENFKAKGEDEYKKHAASRNEMKDWTISKMSIDNATTKDKPVMEHFDVSMLGNVQRSGDLIIINPYVFLREETNPFKEETRKYPVDFDELTDMTMLCTITVPEGYGVDELPANKIFALQNDAARCSFSISQSLNQIHVVTRLKINKTLFTTDEYPNLREFYTRMIAKKGESIIFKKKKTEK